MKTRIAWVAFVFVIFAAMAGAGPAADDADRSLLLKIGDPRFKDKTLDITAGQIYSMETGKPVAFENMIREMKAVPFIHIGESHDSLPIHELQARILEALYEQAPRLAVGLEMFPVTRPEALAKWSLGILAEEEFIRDGRWYLTWNQNFAFYRPIFNFVKNHAIPLYGINAPREIISKIRMRGWEALADSEKAIVPKPDLSHAEHRELMKVIFSNEEMPAAMRGADPNAMFEALYRGQSAWDEIMGANAVRVHALEGRQVVVLVGSGHLLYNLGLNRRAYEKSKLPFKTVIAVPVPKGQTSVKVARTLADYIVGIEAEDRPAYPAIGLGFKTFQGLDNLVIESKPFTGVAAGQDFEKGDVVLAVDGQAFTDANELRTYLARFGWDAEIKFRLLRAGVEKDVTLKLRLPPPTAPEK